MRIWGSILRHARNEADLSQKEIAEAIGVTHDIVSNFEALRTPIPSPKLILWARRCDMDEAELFDRYLYELGKKKTTRR